MLYFNQSTALSNNPQNSLEVAMRFLILSLALMTACAIDPATPIGEPVLLQDQDAQIIVAMTKLDMGGHLIGSRIAIVGSGLQLAHLGDDNWQVPMIVQASATSAFVQAARELQCNHHDCRMLIVPRYEDSSLYMVMSIDGDPCISWDISKDNVIARRPSCG